MVLALWTRSSIGATPASSLPQKLFATRKISISVFVRSQLLERNLDVAIHDKDTLGVPETGPVIVSSLGQSQKPSGLFEVGRWSWSPGVDQRGTQKVTSAAAKENEIDYLLLKEKSWCFGEGCSGRGKVVDLLHCCRLLSSQRVVFNLFTSLDVVVSRSNAAKHHWRQTRFTQAQSTNTGCDY